MKKFLFKKKLLEGIIKSRPNRFIFNVEIEGRHVNCHCPSTGQIASIRFEDIPCLLSESDNKERKTQYTVEAISLEDIDKNPKTWIGINQTKANEYVEFFIKTGQLNKIFPQVQDMKREVKFRNSRIDFLINNTDYLEVKTPLKDIPSKGHRNYQERKNKFNSFDRMIKHFNDISNSINTNSRAIFLLCYLYNAEAFKVPMEKKELNIINAAKRATSAGLENWQVNFNIDAEGITLLDYFRLNLF